MPPGNTNKRASVVNKCSYCGKGSCKGESSHVNYTNRPTLNQYHARDVNVTKSNLETTKKPATIHNSGNTGFTSGERSQGARSSGEIRNASPDVTINNLNAKANLSVISTSTYQPNQKTVVLPSKLNLSSTAGNTSSYQINKKTVDLQDHFNSCSIVSNPSSYQTKKTVVLQDHISSASAVASTSSFLASNKNDLTGRKEDCGDAIGYSKKEVLTESSTELNESFDAEKKCFIHSGPIKANENKIPQVITQFSDINREEKGQETNKINNSSAKNNGECQFSINDKINLKSCQKKHSKKAVICEGVVVILGSRSAKLRVCNADEEPKFVQLFVEKVIPPKNESAYTSDTDINTVLQVGEILKLVCTDHNRKDAGFHLFAHEAQKTGNRTVQNNDPNNCDTESVTSYVSHGSITGSESQGSKLSRSRRRRRPKKEIAECDAHGLSDVIYQWLDQNESLHLNKNPCKIAKLVEGCDYIGKVAELRLPYAFVVEISLDRYSEYVFVFSKYFHPEGPNSQSLAQGVSVKGLVNIGDDVNVVPIRPTQLKQGKLEWVARKAWLIGKGLVTEQPVFTGMQSISEQNSRKCVETQQLGGSDRSYPESENDHNGAILTLQSSWGLVKELGSGSTYVFTKKNAFLFGLCLKNFVLDDVLREGQLVKFVLEDGESGLMNARELHCGNPLPDFNTLEKAIYEYCQERKINFCIENSLIKLGEEFFTLKMTKI